jgi:hypothetical protein
LGAQTSVPTREEVDALLAGGDHDMTTSSDALAAYCGPASTRLAAP